MKVHLATGALPGNSMFTWVSARIRIFMIENDTETRSDEKFRGNVLPKRHGPYDRSRLDVNRSILLSNRRTPDKLFQHARDPRVPINVDLILLLHRIGSCPFNHLTVGASRWRDLLSLLLASRPRMKYRLWSCCCYRFCYSSFTPSSTFSSSLSTCSSLLAGAVAANVAVVGAIDIFFVVKVDGIGIVVVVNTMRSELSLTLTLFPYINYTLLVLVDRRVVPCLYRETMLGGRDYPFPCHCEDPSVRESDDYTYLRSYVCAPLSRTRAFMRERNSCHSFVHVTRSRHVGLISRDRRIEKEGKKKEEEKKERKRSCWSRQTAGRVIPLSRWPLRFLRIRWPRSNECLFKKRALPRNLATEPRRCCDRPILLLATFFRVA